MADLGLTAGQLANAETIIRVGKARGMSDADIRTALAVALAESNLQNYANQNVPESMNIPHDSSWFGSYVRWGVSTAGRDLG